MFFQEYYKYNPKDFDRQGFNTKNNQWFMDLIGEFEHDFNDKFPTCYANHLFANHVTMEIINHAMDLANNESSGMDLFDGEVNLDANLAIEEFSYESTVYAIGSKIEENEDEPIFLVVNDKLSDGLILLRYIDDNEIDEIEEPAVVTILEPDRII